MITGFLSPEGVLFPCDNWEHLDTAQSIVDELGVTVANRVAAEEYLQLRGWLVIRSRDVYGLIGYVDEYYNMIYLSSKQRDWLNDHYNQMTRLQRDCVDDILDKR